MWPVATTDGFDEWFEALGDEERAEIEAKVNLLELFGPALGRPHADTLNESRYRNMKELRADTADHTLRIAFAFDPSRAAILLVGGDKRGRSQRPFYRQLIAKADMLYAEHLDKLKTTAKKRGGK
jgi:hypothetical protein